MTNTAKTQKLLLPALILTTPFLVFLNYNSYCLGCAETWIVLIALILFAIVCSVVMLVSGRKVSALIMALLITAFIDLQFTPWNLWEWADEWVAILLFAGMQSFVAFLFLKEKLYTIATAVFLTFFAVTIFKLALNTNNNYSLFKHRESGIQTAPRIIHLILDEHIGIEGIPTDIEGGLATKTLITQFYLKNGFQLFGGAFSRYFNTHNSISSMLNFGAENKDDGYIRGRNPYRLLRNKYFEMLSKKNYNIEVLSPGEVDFCSGLTVLISRCVQYNAESLHVLGKLDIRAAQKLQVILSRYLSQSSIASWIIPEVVLIYHSVLGGSDMSLLQWAWALDHERTRLHSLNSLAVLESLWDNILSLPRGTALVAHLLIPHFPYVAKADCSIRSPSGNFLWNNRGLRTQAAPTNTIDSRRERYGLYFQQVECVYLKLDKLFDRMRATGIYDDSIIIIHGDHGSKIVVTDSISENRHLLTKQDLVDGFSTFFAMKLPGKPGGYDNSPWSLEQLFAKFVFEAGLTPTNILIEKSEPFVYLTSDSVADFIRIPYAPPKLAEN
jgi:hypothetical protein